MTDVFSPISGVSLEKYAELAAQMAESVSDKGKWVTIAGANGVG
jgi:hypothetical protein